MATTVGKLILQLGIEAGDLSALDKFENQTKDAAKGANEAATKTKIFRDRLVALRPQLQKISNELMKMRNWAVFVAAALTALSIRGSMVAQSLHRFSLTTGLSSKELDKWQQKAALSGVAADEFKDSMVGLQRAAMEVQQGGGNAAPFAFLQITPSKNAFAMWDQLIKRAGSMDPAKFSLYASMLGLSENMIALAREAQELGPVDQSLLLTDDDLKNLKEFNIIFNRTWDNIKRTGNKVGALMAPIAEWVMFVFNKLARGGLQVATYAKKLWEIMGPFKGALAGLIPLFVAWFPWTSAIIAATVALDDILTFMRGGDSVLGRFIGYFSDWRRILQDLVILLATVGDLVESAVGGKILKYLIGKATGTERQGFGEATMDAATAAGVFNDYRDSPIATMRDGKMTMVNSKGEPINVTVNQNISGAGAPERAADRAAKAFQSAMQRMNVPQGSAPAAAAVPGG